MRKLFTKLFAVTFLLLVCTWTTVIGQTITSTPTGGLWSATSTWNGGVVPVAANDVVIADGATVTIDTAPTINSITVGQGTSGILTFDGVAARAVIVTGGIIITANGSFIVQSTGTFTNTLSVGGNITNNGTFDMSRNSSTTICTVTFNGTGEQDLSGTAPVLTRFRGITVNKSSTTDPVKSTIDTQFAGSNLLVLNTGTWEQNAGNLINLSGSQTLGSANGVLLIDGSGGYTNYNGTAYTSASLTVSVGTFTVNTTGIVQIGVGNNSIITGGTIDLKAGTIKVYGRLTITTGTTTIEGANIYIDPNPSFTGATALGATSATFEVSGASGSFTFSSGSVTLVNPNAAATTGRDLKLTGTGTISISGGTIYIGDGTSTKTSSTYSGFLNGSTITIPNNIVVQTGTIVGRNFSLNQSNLSVSGTLTVATNGILDCASNKITGTGVFNLNTGATIKTSIATGINGAITTTGTNSLSTGANYEFDGPTASAVTGTSMPATVNSLIVTNTTGVTLSQATIVTGATTVNAGALLKTGVNTFTNNGTATINGSFQIDESGWATGNNFVYGTAGTLVFNNTSVNYGVGANPAYWPSTSGPVNVTVMGGGIQLQASQTVTGTFQTSASVGNTFGNNLTVSGSVKLNSGGYFSNFSPTYTNTGTLVYNTTGSYGVNNEWLSGTTAGYGVPQNVTVLNATLVNLSGSRTIPGTLALTSGKIDLGANNLTVASTGSITGASATGYIVTDGAGTLTQTIGAGAAATFPIGASTASYDPATLTPTNATDVAVNVGLTLPAVAAADYSYNAKVWNVTPTAPSSTIVTLTPSAAVTTIAGDVIGQYISGSYVNSPATRTGTGYTATFTTFAPFVTGTTDLGTSISQTRIAGVYFDGLTIHNDAKLNLQVYDATGRMMLSSVKDINMSSNPKGVYVVKSTSGSLKIVL